VVVDFGQGDSLDRLQRAAPRAGLAVGGLWSWWYWALRLSA